MIYIYNCYGGTHSSSIASEIHLGRLPTDRVPTTDEIINAAYFNKLRYKDMGVLIFRGMDDENNRVFTLGRGTSKVLVPCLENLIKILQNDYGLKEKIVMSNMSPAVAFTMTMGGFLSRALHIDFLGVPLLVMGVKKNYKMTIEMVNKTKETAKNMKENTKILKNKNS